MTTLGQLAIMITGAFVVAHVVHGYMHGRTVLTPLNTFWAGFMVIYVLQPLEFGGALAEWYAPGVLTSGALLVLLAVACVALGHASRIGPALSERIPALPSRLSPGRLRLGAWCLIGLGLVGYAYMMGTAGGAAQWLAVSRGGTDWRVASAYIAGLGRLLPVGVGVLLFEAEIHRVSHERRVLVWCAAAIMLAWFLYLGSRSRTVSWTVLMLAAYYLPRAKNPPLHLLAAGFLVLLLMTGVLAACRGEFRNGSFNLSRVDWNELSEQVVPFGVGTGHNAEARARAAARGMEYSCALAAIDLVPAEVPYNYGYCLLEFITRVVPRAFWPGKVYPHYEAFTPLYERAHLTSYVVPTSRKRILAGPAFTFVGHWYAVGGVVALVVASLLTGCMFRAILGVYTRDRSNEAGVILYGSFIMVGFAEAATTPLFFIFGLPFKLIPLLLIVHLARVRDPAASPRHRPVPEPTVREVEVVPEGGN